MLRIPWAEAHREADARSLGYIGTDLVLLGLARGEGVAGDVLRDLGATPAAIEAAIDRLHANDETSRPEAGVKGRPSRVRPTPAAEHARGRASGIAIGLGERTTREHLLLALAYDRSGIHTDVLHQVGVTRSAIVEVLRAQGIGATSPPPRDPDPMTQSVTMPDAHARVVAAELGRRSIGVRATYSDEEGHGRWSYGGARERPGDACVRAQESIDLRGLSARHSMLPASRNLPEEQWETLTPG